MCITTFRRANRCHVFVKRLYNKNGCFANLSDDACNLTNKNQVILKLYFTNFAYQCTVVVGVIINDHFSKNNGYSRMYASFVGDLFPEFASWNRLVPKATFASLRFVEVNPHVFDRGGLFLAFATNHTSALEGLNDVGILCKMKIKKIVNK